MRRKCDMYMISMICKYIFAEQYTSFIVDFYKRTVKFLARCSYLVHMARGRRGRPASVRSRVSRVNVDIEDPAARPSRTRERRSSRSHVAASSGSGRSSSPSRRSAREHSHRRRRSASRSPEPPKS